MRASRRNIPGAPRLQKGRDVWRVQHALRPTILRLSINVVNEKRLANPRHIAPHAPGHQARAGDGRPSTLC